MVATDSGGPREIITNGEDGFLVDVGNTKDMQAAVRKLLQDPGLWDRFSRAGRENAFRNYTWSGMARKEVDIFKGILRGSFNP